MERDMVGWLSTNTENSAGQLGESDGIIPFPAAEQTYTPTCAHVVPAQAGIHLSLN